MCWSLWHLWDFITQIKPYCEIPSPTTCRANVTKQTYLAFQREWKLESWISLAKKTRMYVLSRICMYTGWYPMQKSFPFSIWFLFWWLTLYYKVRLANNGPLYDMILVWSKCDFFRSARIMVMIGETKCPDQACRLLCHLIVTSAFFRLLFSVSLFYFGIFWSKYFWISKNNNKMFLY